MSEKAEKMSDKEGLLNRFEGDDESSLDVERSGLPNLQVNCRWTATIKCGWPSIYQIFTTVSTLTSIAALGMLVVILGRLPSSPSTTVMASTAIDHDPVWKSCGLNSTTARKNGCRYDLMLSAWIHDDCYDKDLMESYLAAHDYTWYADSELTDPLPDEVVRLGDHVRVYVEPEFHYVHCAYMWEMQMRAWVAGKAVDMRIWEVGHSSHCGKLLVQHVLPRNFTKLTVGFDPCGVP